MVKISEEQRSALKQNPEGVSCEDTNSARPFFLVEESVHRRAMQALKHLQDLEAVGSADGRWLRDSGGGSSSAIGAETGLFGQGLVK